MAVIITGLYLTERLEIRELNRTPRYPLVISLSERLCPGSSALDALQEEYR